MKIGVAVKAGRPFISKTEFQLRTSATQLSKLSPTPHFRAYAVLSQELPTRTPRPKAWSLATSALVAAAVLEPAVWRALISYRSPPRLLA